MPERPYRENGPEQRRAQGGLAVVVARFPRGASSDDLLVPASLVLCLLVLAVVGWNQSLASRSIEQAAVRAAQNVVAVAGRDIETTIGIYDTFLGALVASFPPAESLAASRPHREALFELAAALPDLGTVRITDADGHVVEAVPALGVHEAARAGAAGRDWFTAVADPRSGLYVGAPRMGLHGDGPVITLSRRIAAPDGSLRGVAMAELRVVFFERLVGEVELGRDGVMWVAWLDGTLVARRPPAPDNVAATSAAAAERRQRLAIADRGTYKIASAIDGIERLYTFERVDALPIGVAVGTGVEAVYAEWRPRLLLGVAMTGALCVLLVGMALLLRREFARRNGLERELREQSETDPLTGLANRRRFERSIETELRRARRHGSPISVLMVDVDGFKHINDRFGHGHGDVVLRVIAERLAATVRRPGDLAARVGGDEFALLLPETGEEGAQTVAEAAREAVARHVFPAPGGTTITIGVATAAGNEGVSGAELLAAADRALYAAKAAGRNRIGAAA